MIDFENVRIEGDSLDDLREMKDRAVSIVLTGYQNIREQFCDELGYPQLRPSDKWLSISDANHLGPEVGTPKTKNQLEGAAGSNYSGSREPDSEVVEDPDEFFLFGHEALPLQEKLKRYFSFPVASRVLRKTNTNR